MPNTMVQYNIPNNKADKTKSVSSINIVLLLGIIFIALSGMIFATTSLFLPPPFRSLTLLLVTVTFLIVSIFSEKKLKINKIAIAFFCLGTFFVPITIMSAAQGLNIIIASNGVYFQLALASIGLCLASFFGAERFKFQPFAYAFLSAITLTVACFLKGLNTTNDIFVLILSLYSTIMLFTEPVLRKANGEKNKFVFTCASNFAIINTIALCILCVLISKQTYISSLSILLFAFSFVFYKLNSSTLNYGAYPFMLLMLIALYKFITPNDYSDYFILFTAASVTATVMGYAGIIGDKFKQALSGISAVVMLLGVLFCGIPAVITAWTLTGLITVFIMLINISWLAIKQKDKLYYAFHALVLNVFIYAVSQYLLKGFVNVAVLSSVIMAIAFVVYKYTKIFRTIYSDIMFTAIPFIYIVEIMANSKYKNGVAMLCCSIVLVLIIGCVVFEKSSSILKNIYDWLLPLSIYTIFYSVHIITGVNAQLSYFIYYAIILTLSAASTLLKEKYGLATRFVPCLNIYSLAFAGIGLIITFFDFANTYMYPYLWLLAVLLGIKSYVFNQSGKLPERDVNLYLSLVLMLEASIISTANYTDNHLIWVLVPTLISLSAFIVNEISTKAYKKSFALQNQISLFCMVSNAITAYSLMFLLANEPKANWLYYVLNFAVLAVSYIQFNKQKSNMLAFFPLLILYPLINQFIVSLNVDNSKLIISIASITVFILSAVLARITRKYILYKQDNNLQIDWLTILSILSFLNIKFENNAYFYNLILLIVYILLYYKRVAYKFADNIVLTISSGIAVISFWAQPFFVLPKLFKDEINLIPVALFCVAIKLIWQNYKTKSDIACFIIAVISMINLVSNALLLQQLIDALIVGGVSFIMLIISYIYKRKKWFFLSVIILLFISIYLSKSFWLSIAWWVYLLVIGVILFSIASYNEIKKQKGSSVKASLSRFMVDWQW